MNDVTRTSKEQVGPFVVGDGGGTGENRFRTMKQGLSAWTLDIDEALQFSRRKDAETFAADDEEAWQILPVPGAAHEPAADSEAYRLLNAALYYVPKPRQIHGEIVAYLNRPTQPPIPSPLSKAACVFAGPVKDSFILKLWFETQADLDAAFDLVEGSAGFVPMESSGPTKGDCQ